MTSAKWMLLLLPLALHGAAGFSAFCNVARVSLAVVPPSSPSLHGCQHHRPVQRQRFPFAATPTWFTTASPTSPSALAMSSTVPTATTPEQDQANVVFQKVVRPPPNIPDVLFLGYLIEYLEKHYELPSRLPMTYESLPMHDDEKKHCALIWDSSLSPCSEHTRMKVEVVGIYTDSSDTLPRMAMVVVRKENGSSSPLPSVLPPMMVGLFQDSENKILKSLDRGLEDFMHGKIKFQMDEEEKAEQERRHKQHENFETAEQVIQAELVDDDDQHVSREKLQSMGGNNGVIDAVVDTTAEEHKKADEKQVEAEGEILTKKTQNGTAKAASATPASPQSSKSEPMSSSPPPSSSSPPPSSTVSSSASPVDFAVKQAKRIAQKNRDKQIPSSNYAVEAAKQMAHQQKKTQPGAKIPTTTTTKRKVARKRKKKAAVEYEDDDPSDTQFSKWKAKNTTPRAFETTISHPREYLNKRMQALQKSKSGVKTTAKAKAKTKIFRGNKSTKNPEPVEASVPATAAAAVSPPQLNQKEQPATATATARSIPPVKKKTPLVSTKRKLNIRVVNDDDQDHDEMISKVQGLPAFDDNAKFNIEKQVDAPRSKSAPKSESTSTDGEPPSKEAMPSDEQLQLDIMTAAKDIMSEIADQGKDLTAEEMLQDVLKFDSEQKKENQPGAGFATGAFIKAKELLQEQHKKRQERLQARVVDKASSEFMTTRPDIVDPNDAAAQGQTKEARELSPEEELRAMFEAGQNLAEGRINTAIDKQGGMAGGQMANSKKMTTEEDIDELIASEKEISSYARVLDDDLVELEVRINKSPGEEYDGPMKNPVFDVMSGPEVYNPNVDPETVNYPGAMPGTKKVKMPKELDEAVKQAGFAAEVLRSMKIVEGKDDAGDPTYQYFSGDKEMTTEQVVDLQRVVNDAARIGLVNDPMEYLSEKSRLQMVLDELWDQPEERFRDIASNFKDLLLSDNFVKLIEERLTNMADRDLEALRRDDESLEEGHAKERQLLGQLVVYAQLLLKETRALGAELEAQQLEIVRSICKVAMDPAHQTEEETAMALTDAVRDMRPLLDDVFIAYLKYAVAEEEARLARAGLLDDPEHNQWLFVLKIVQQGVYTEVSRSINRYIDHITYVLRMKTPNQRRMLLKMLIDDMPTMDVRPFVQVVDNIVGALGDAARGEFDGVMELGEMTNKLLQLRRDMDELLPPERIALKSKDADEWAAKQKKKLMESRKISRQRLQAAQELEAREEEIEEFHRRGEVEEF